jgi:hypothetical protein
MLFFVLAFALYFGTLAWATPDVLWEGRAPFNYTADDINQSLGPYLKYVVPPIIEMVDSYMKDRSVVKGRHKASYVCGFSQSPVPRTRLIDFSL